MELGSVYWPRIAKPQTHLKRKPYPKIQHLYFSLQNLKQMSTKCYFSAKIHVCSDT